MPKVNEKRYEQIWELQERAYHLYQTTGLSYEQVGNILNPKRSRQWVKDAVDIMKKFSTGESGQNLTGDKARDTL